MKKVMVLHADISDMGSEYTISLGLTPEEWNKMSTYEQNSFITEYWNNLCVLWVTEEHSDKV